MSSEQEKFWQGKFGNEYIQRANTHALYKSDLKLFNDIFKLTGQIKTVLEFGCNKGLNLKAINNINSSIKVTGIEINKKAAAEAKKNIKANIIEDSIFNVNLDYKFDLVFTKGVLIHLDPNKISKAYKKLYEHSKKFILIAEYYNPTPVEVSYRGHNGKLFKRDFAGDMMKKYSDLKLIDYSFIYKNDPKYPDDDITWFLLKKKKQ